MRGCSLSWPTARWDADPAEPKRLRVKSLICGIVVVLSCLVAGTSHAQQVSMARSVPYSDDAEVSKKVRNECVQLNTQLADFTKEFGREFGVEVALVDSVTSSMSGRVLMVEIVDAVSAGNAFIGHQKYSRIKGALYQDGEKVASFKGRRDSMGGAFGGYKGSCSVLGRTMKALGKDVAIWLKSPTDGAELGDY